MRAEESQSLRFSLGHTTDSAMLIAFVIYYVPHANVQEDQECRGAA
jgi:hypothetical protein